ncbi:MAG: hypothetical protein KIT31_21530 [Deltaproteobacteria bacterium]|nr:hypothetical protein [Deltaproteobacteria bacterium]
MRSLLLVAVLAACFAPDSSAAPDTKATPTPAKPKVSITFAEAQALFPMVKKACADIECLITEAYRADPKAQTLALALYRDSGNVAGVGPEELMDGGYRGKIQLVPELPIHNYRTHLQWVSDAMRATDAFFAKLFDKHPAPAYRWRDVQFRFVRSVGKRTPSAYALKWMVAYNVEGTLLTSAAGVFETIFHELFHTNDHERGDWSAKHLQKDYDAIVAKCGTKMTCLRPFAPNTTIVLATGTYYAFQQNNGNGVHEYAAELAVRYWREQNEMLTKGKLSAPAFKCGPPENARSWKAFVDEFFAGRDLTPAC